MTKKRRTGVFGGTFDPPHIGHLAAVQDAAWTLGLDRVLFVPNNQPPHKSGDAVSEVSDRVAMVERAVEGNPLFEVSLIELERPGPSYTLDTLRELRRRLPDGEQVTFIAGCDALNQLQTWHEPETLLREFEVVVMDRPVDGIVSWSDVEKFFPNIRRQVQIVHVVQLEISSSEIRQRLAAGRPIRYYVVPSVEAYIYEHGLYRRANL